MVSDQASQDGAGWRRMPLLVVRLTVDFLRACAASLAPPCGRLSLRPNSVADLHECRKNFTFWVLPKRAKCGGANTPKFQVSVRF